MLEMEQWLSKVKKLIMITTMKFVKKWLNDSLQQWLKNTTINHKLATGHYYHRADTTFI